MKTLRMARNIAALSIVAMALVASPPGRAAQAEGNGKGSCDQAISPCCCDKSGHTQLDKSDPYYLSCKTTCLAGGGGPGFALAPSSWVKAQNTQQQGSVVGSWVNTVMVYTPSGSLQPLATELLAINPGGTFVDTLTIAHSSQNPSFTGPFAPLAVEFSDAIGTWQPVGDSNQIAFTFQRFLFAGPDTPTSDYPTPDGGPFFPGEYVGVATIEAVGTLQNTANGQILSGTYTFQLMNLRGINVLPGAKGTFSATRIQIQPLATP